VSAGGGCSLRIRGTVKAGGVGFLCKSEFGECVEQRLTSREARYWSGEELPWPEGAAACGHVPSLKQKFSLLQQSLVKQSDELNVPETWLCLRFMISGIIEIKSGTASVTELTRDLVISLKTLQISILG